MVVGELFSIGGFQNLKKLRGRVPFQGPRSGREESVIVGHWVGEYVSASYKRKGANRDSPKACIAWHVLWTRPVNRIPGQLQYSLHNSYCPASRKGTLQKCVRLILL